MFKWKKLGRIFDPTKVDGIPWLKEFAQAPCVLIFDEFVRVYFSCRPPADSNGQYISHTAYVDLDRKNLFEIKEFSQSPIMELGTFGAFDEFGIYPTSVIRNNDEIWAYYGGWTRCESVPYNVSIGLAKSKNDGITFERIGDGPLISFSLNEPCTISGPKIRKFNNKWYLFYVAGKKWIPGLVQPESVFKIRMAVSECGIVWNKYDKDIIENILEEDECQASPDVFYYNDRYHMFFCYKYSFDFRNKERGYRIGYASSVDLVNWKRDDSLVGINVSEDGWDSETISYPHIFELDSQIYMFYLGNQVGKVGFGLAKLEGTF